ncbi:hypothetical protein EYZ11_007980, partial [Aspergillus tanneri]
RSIQGGRRETMPLNEVIMLLFDTVYVGGLYDIFGGQNASATSSYSSKGTLVRVLSTFRTTSTTALEVEYYTIPTHLRLKRRAQTVIALSTPQ